MYSRRGSLFIPNFKRSEITDDTYLTAVIVYIHRNPVHHGFTIDWTKWRLSSYQTILSEKPTALKREEVLKWFGNVDQFLKIHRDEKLSKSLELLESHLPPDTSKNIPVE